MPEIIDPAEKFMKKILARIENIMFFLKKISEEERSDHSEVATELLQIKSALSGIYASLKMCENEGVVPEFKIISLYYETLLRIAGDGSIIEIDPDAEKSHKKKVEKSGIPIMSGLKSLDRIVRTYERQITPEHICDRIMYFIGKKRPEKMIKALREAGDQYKKDDGFGKAIYHLTLFGLHVNDSASDLSDEAYEAKKKNIENDESPQLQGLSTNDLTKFLVGAAKTYQNEIDILQLIRMVQHLKKQEKAQTRHSSLKEKHEQIQNELRGIHKGQQQLEEQHLRIEEGQQQLEEGYLRSKYDRFLENLNNKIIEHLCIVREDGISMFKNALTVVKHAFKGAAVGTVKTFFGIQIDGMSPDLKKACQNLTKQIKNLMKKKTNILHKVGSEKSPVELVIDKLQLYEFLCSRDPSKKDHQELIRAITETPTQKEALNFISYLCLISALRMEQCHGKKSAEGALARVVQKFQMNIEKRIKQEILPSLQVVASIYEKIQAMDQYLEQETVQHSLLVNDNIALLLAGIEKHQTAHPELNVMLSPIADFLGEKLENDEIDGSEYRDIKENIISLLIGQLASCDIPLPLHHLEYFLRLVVKLLPNLHLVTNQNNLQKGPNKKKKVQQVHLSMDEPTQAKTETQHPGIAHTASDTSPATATGDIITPNTDRDARGDSEKASKNVGHTPNKSSSCYKCGILTPSHPKPSDAALPPSPPSKRPSDVSSGRENSHPMRFFSHAEDKIRVERIIRNRSRSTSSRLPR